MPLLERQPALDLLGAALADATGGAGRVALVAGEAGIGKTSLVRAFTADVPVRVLRGACDDLLTPGPLGPVRDVARMLGGPLAAALAGGPGEVADALLDVLATPSVLVVEDVHWADEATLDLLAFLGRRVEQCPSLVVLTYRDDELGPASALRRVLGVLRPPVAVRIALPPLSLQAVLGLAGDRGVGLRVHGRTRGNPFLVTELLAAGSDGAGLPASVSEAVLGRLARLDPGPRDLVDRVAVVPARAEGPLLDALHPAWRADAAPAEELGLLELRDGGLAFRHELARTAVEQALPRTRRLQLDEDVVRVLLAGPDPDLARVLHHAARCGAAAVVVEHGPAAARAAAAAGAHRQSLDFYTQLLPHVAALPAEERAAVGEEYAWELYNAHRFDAAADAAARAVALREELGDPARLGQALVTLSRQRYMQADMAAARTTGDRAVTLLAGTSDRPRLALARTYRGVLLTLIDHEEEALAELAEARELATAVGRRDLVALCLNYQGLARIFLGETDAGLALLDDSVREAEAIGHQEYVARAYTSLVKGLRRAGRLLEMERLVRERLDRLREADFLSHAYTLEAHALLVRAVRGDWAGAEEGLAELLDQVPDAGVLGRETLPLLARLRVRRGAPDAAAALERSWDLARRTDILQALVPTAVAAVEQAWLAGEPVPEAVDPVLARTARPGAERYRGELLRHLARAGRPAEPFPGCPEEYAAGLRGDWRAAAAAWERIGDPYERALELAESGRPEPTLEALQLLDELGAEPAALLVRRRLRDLGVARIPRGPLPATRENPAGLTDRQVEILRLVARGRTNAEIAAALVLSVRTVDHHVSAVLQKLGVATRREAAARAPDLLGPDDRARR